jgi:hypothetical protein
MACKSFFCPAWEEIPCRRLDILVDAVQDWHHYGLVVTDVDFVTAVFEVLEDAVGNTLEPEVLWSTEAGSVFLEILSWKDSWPFKGSSTLRRNRYYFKRGIPDEPREQKSHIDDLMGILKFTYGLSEITQGWRETLSLTVDRFIRSYNGRSREAK